MFGYLVAATKVLENEDLARYKSVYCGLCRSLSRCFGQTARLTLNFDMTFLVLLLGSLYEPEEALSERHCCPAIRSRRIPTASARSPTTPPV